MREMQITPYHIELIIDELMTGKQKRRERRARERKRRIN